MVNPHITYDKKALADQAVTVLAHIQDMCTDIVSALNTTIEYKNAALDEYKDGSKKRQMKNELVELNSCVIIINKNLGILEKVVTLWLEGDRVIAAHTTEELLINELYINLICAHDFLIRQYNSAPVRREFIELIFSDLTHINSFIL